MCDIWEKWALERKMHLLPRLFKLGQGAAERCIECLARTLRVLESPLEREDLGVALGVGGECSRIELGDAALGAPDDKQYIYIIYIYDGGMGVVWQMARMAGV